MAFLFPRRMKETHVVLFIRLEHNFSEPDLIRFPKVPSGLGCRTLYNEFGTRA